MPARLLIAAPSSNSGKTTVTASLCAAFRAQGKTVQAFKVGPDYIDPSHLALASGRPVSNLDSFFLDEHALAQHFIKMQQGADISLIEGVMGLFDGRDAEGKEASSAHIAQLLDIPVLLVVDASAMAGSIAAIAQGFATFREGVRIIGVVANRVGSERHAAILDKALAAIDIPLLGFMLRHKDLHIPSRHLGLTMPKEQHIDIEALEKAATHLDIARIYDIASSMSSLPMVLDKEIIADTHIVGAKPQEPRVRIAIARDEAFCFYYAENFRELEYAGAELCFFSPLHDAHLPDDISAIYLGGGYPELYAEKLVQNTAMMQALRAFTGIIYAECGGRMVLSEALHYQGVRYEMLGLLQGACFLDEDSRVTIGYRELEVMQDSPVVAKGMQPKGHEFHYSQQKGCPDNLYRQQASAARAKSSDTCEGFTNARIHASYVHLYFPSTPEIAHRFVESAYQAQSSVC